MEFQGFYSDLYSLLSRHSLNSDNFFPEFCVRCDGRQKALNSLTSANNFLFAKPLIPELLMNSFGRLACMDDAQSKPYGALYMVCELVCENLLFRNDTDGLAKAENVTANCAAILGLNGKSCEVLASCIVDCLPHDYDSDIELPRAIDILSKSDSKLKQGAAFVLLLKGKAAASAELASGQLLAISLLNCGRLDAACAIDGALHLCAAFLWNERRFSEFSDLLDRELAYGVVRDFLMRKLSSGFHSDDGKTAAQLLVVHYLRAGKIFDAVAVMSKIENPPEGLVLLVDSAKSLLPAHAASAFENGSWVEAAAKIGYVFDSRKEKMSTEISVAWSPSVDLRLPASRSSEYFLSPRKAPTFEQPEQSLFTGIPGRAPRVRSREPPQQVRADMFAGITGRVGPMTRARARGP